MRFVLNNGITKVATYYETKGVHKGHEAVFKKVFWGLFKHKMMDPIFMCRFYLCLYMEKRLQQMEGHHRKQPRQPGDAESPGN